jgi:hypothetical protein
MGRGNEERGVLINEKHNQGVWERKKVGIHWSTLRAFPLGIPTKTTYFMSPHACYTTYTFYFP